MCLRSQGVCLNLFYRWDFQSVPQNCAVSKTCMFFSPSPLKSGQVAQISPIDLLDHVCTEWRCFYISKLPWVDQWERLGSNFVDFTFLTTEGSSSNQNLTEWNRNMSRKYHVHYTQEFPYRYLDELLIFLKETHFPRNTEEGHLAYSYP